MAYGFRPYQLDQLWLLPAAPRAWLPDGHLALFVADLVSHLDLRAILRAYPGGRGPRGYHPQMLLTVLLYGYCVGVFSSRKLAARCETDVAFRVLAGGAFRTFGPWRTFGAGTWRHSKSCLSSCCGCVGRPGWSSSAISPWMGRSSRPTPRSTRR